MRFSAALILLFMLAAGFAVPKAWAHDGTHGTVVVSEHTKPEPEAAPADVESGLGLHPYSRLPDGHGKLSNCLTAVGCAGISSVLGEGFSVPIPQRITPAPLFPAGERPQSVEPPVDDRPPRA